MMKRRIFSHKRIVFVLIGLCFAVGGFFIGMGSMVYLITPKISEKEKDALSYEAIMGKNSSQILEKSREYISINQVISFDDSQSEGAANIVNKKENDMSITISLYLDRDGRLLYASDLVDPGFHIEKIRLTERLSAGEYACTAVYRFYREADDQFSGETASKTVIVIRN